VEEGRRPARAVAIVALLVSCGGKSAPSPAPRIANALAAALAAADVERAPWRCAALDTPALPDIQLTTGKAKWQLGGHTLRRIAGTGELTIGVIADAADATPATIAALGRLRGEFEKASVDLVISLGGMGETQKDLEATLGTLGDHAPWPVVALPGDLEPAGAQVAALANLRRRGAAVLDGRLVRWIEQEGTGAGATTATVATLPGAGARERLSAGVDGCLWRADDVAKLYVQLTAKPGMRILASAEAPRSMVHGEPSGELALVPPQPIDVALHGPVMPDPSPAKAGGRDGAKAVLSPGTADATRRLPDPHVPGAGLLVIRGGTWSWRPLLVGR
jgi:hypothetical protein